MPWFVERRPGVRIVVEFSNVVQHLRVGDDGLVRALSANDHSKFEHQAADGFHRRHFGQVGLPIPPIGQVPLHGRGEVEARIHQSRRDLSHPVRE